MRSQPGGCPRKSRRKAAHSASKLPLCLGGSLDCTWVPTQLFVLLRVFLAVATGITERDDVAGSAGARA